MSAVRKVSVSVTTDSGGDSTDFSEVITGRLLGIAFVDTDLAAGADFTITTDAAAQALLTVTDAGSSTTWHPRQPTHATDGTASLYASTGEPVESDIPIFQDRIKIVTAQGGATKSGRFDIWVG